MPKGIKSCAAHRPLTDPVTGNIINFDLRKEANRRWPIKSEWCPASVQSAMKVDNLATIGEKAAVPVKTMKKHKFSVTALLRCRLNTRRCVLLREGPYLAFCLFMSSTTPQYVHASETLHLPPKHYCSNMLDLAPH
jgi:hypothetical protein